MYEYIKGTLISKRDNIIVVECGGIGYKINTTGNTIQALSPGEVTVYTVLYVREDIFELYGFATADERSTFELLLSVSGVGPKAAASILSSISPSNLAIAVVTDTPKAITAAQGVGPKLAQRIILDLKDKIKSSAVLKPDTNPNADIAPENEVVMALTALGYSLNDALTAVGSAPKGLSVSETIKHALKSFA